MTGEIGGREELMTVAVLGAGAWGTALARQLTAQSGIGGVRLWTWQAEHAEQMRTTRENPFLRGVRLPENITLTHELSVALAGADVTLLVVPSTALRATLLAAAPFVGASMIVNATKGIEDGTWMTMGEVVADVLGAEAASRYAVLSGPSFAREVVDGHPTNVVVASQDAALRSRIQTAFSSERFRVYTSDDPRGVEIAGALKNVIAIAAGACDGLGYGSNTRAALITRGLAEIARLAVAKGGNPLTVTGLAGLGDLVLTCTGEQSRNRTLGFEAGKGKALPDILGAMEHVAEGVPTAQSAVRLAEKLGVDLPICTAVYRVLYEGQSASDAVLGLLSRPPRWERE